MDISPQEDPRNWSKEQVKQAIDRERASFRLTIREGDVDAAARHKALLGLYEDELRIRR